LDVGVIEALRLVTWQYTTLNGIFEVFLLAVDVTQTLCLVMTGVHDPKRHLLKGN